VHFLCVARVYWCCVHCVCLRGEYKKSPLHARCEGQGLLKVCTGVQYFFLSVDVGTVSRLVCVVG